MIRTLINSQIWLSYNFDKVFPMKYRIDGNQDYINSLVPSYLKENLIIYDVGGGKGPYLSADKKNELNATVVGLDIDKEELQQAPEGAYNKIICADISNFQGNQDADIVLCQAVLEHVKDVENAFAAISSILKNGGLALIFVPSRNAVFARLNIILPQNVKKAILHYVYPNTARDQGFPSYYNKCTPLEFKQLARDNNFSVIEERFYFKSGYFTFFFPAYLVWRLWILLFHFLLKEQSAETFSIVLKKRR
jgi:2-polyprenyl-3-methyl-5-hydroxy-6-metoxy-1,4-benzoquinol methylase